ncbi:MAG: lipopolysaccharide heptosyltransferase II [Acidobacteria bacterium]|nr:MAG: lipopolysaccharide heptosyltransferase II [Acidobacteriota bacterium]
MCLIESSWHVETRGNRMKKNKILIRMSNWVGDFIMNIPAAELIRRTYPEAEIHWIGRPYLRELSIFRSDLYDQYIEFDDKGELRPVNKLISFAVNLRHQKYDKAFIFTSHIKGALISWLGRVPVRIGYAKSFFSFLYTDHEIRNSPTAGKDDFISMYLELLKKDQIDISQARLPKLNKVVGLEQQVTETFIRGKQAPFLLIHAGAASSSAKRWLPERFAEVADRFHKETGGTSILIGVQSEADINRELINAQKYPESTLNLVGRTSLKQAIVLTSTCQYVLSNDSGFMHIAAAYGIPSVAVFGPTDPAFSTYGKARNFSSEVECSPCHLKKCPKAHECMKEIKVDRVWHEGLLPLIRSEEKTVFETNYKESKTGVV